ncbi:MAG: response regulator [Anaerolineae bacterium]|nr:response regulator [Anaerolineae bacterium]
MTSTARILVIDDDPDFVEFVRIILEAGGYTVFCAYNAEQGLELLRLERPDLVLLDMLMSYSMAGPEVTRTMQQDAELRTIPLIVISSVFTDKQAIEQQETFAFVSAFLTKPVEPSDLVQLIEKTLASDNP